MTTQFITDAEVLIFDNVKSISKEEFEQVYENWKEYGLLGELQKALRKAINTEIIYKAFVRQSDVYIEYGKQDLFGENPTQFAVVENFIGFKRIDLHNNV